MSSLGRSESERTPSLHLHRVRNRISPSMRMLHGYAASTSARFWSEQIGWDDAQEQQFFGSHQ